MPPTLRPRGNRSRDVIETNGDDLSRPSKSAKRDRGDAAPTATFWHLPEEIRSIVLHLACSRRRNDVDDEDDISTVHRTWRIRLDVPTTARLARVSRDFHKTFNDALWSHVRIDRPSTLAAFHRAVWDKPELGKRIKSLHIGPTSGLPKGGWPFRWYTEADGLDPGCLPNALFRTGLTSTDEAADRLPRWCPPDEEWAYEFLPHGCRDRHVDAALRKALRDIVVEPDFGEDFGPGAREKLGINKWTLRLFEAQAVLDLYLMEMRRVDDVEQRPASSWRCEKSEASEKPYKLTGRRCWHYPKLMLEGFEANKAGVERSESAETEASSAAGSEKDGEEGKESSREVSGGNSEAESTSKKRAGNGEGPDARAKQSAYVFVVTRQQVKAHLSRRGSPGDHFDHPLLVARTRLRMLTLDDDGAVIVDPAGYGDEFYDEEELDDEGSEDFGVPSVDDVSDEASEASLSFNGSSRSSSSRGPGRRLSRDSSSCSSDVWDPSRRDGLLGLAGSVFRFLPNVKNLALTGFFHHIISKQRPSSIPTKVAYLCADPLSPYSDAGLLFHDMQLLALEKFRICGHYFGRSLAGQIAGLRGYWPKLREATWDFGHAQVLPLPPTSEQFLLDLLNIMQGRSSGGMPPAGAVTEEGAELRTSSQHQDVQAQPQSRYIEARLHSSYVSTLLDMAPTQEVRAAWQEGLTVSDAPHRVLLVQSRAASQPANFFDEPSQDFDVLLRESVQWWEERALELERSKEAEE